MCKCARHRFLRLSLVLAPALGGSWVSALSWESCSSAQYSGCGRLVQLGCDGGHWVRICVGCWGGVGLYLLLDGNTEASGPAVLQGPASTGTETEQLSLESDVRRLCVFRRCGAGHGNGICVAARVRLKLSFGLEGVNSTETCGSRLGSGIYEKRLSMKAGAVALVVVVRVSVL